MKKYTNTGFVALKTIAAVVLIFISSMQSIAQAPVITSVSVPASNCYSAVSHLVSANVVAGSGTLTSVTLNYNNGSAGSIAMTPLGAVYSATIPVASPANWNVTWSITAVNSLSQTTTVIGDGYKDLPYLNVNAFATASANPVCSGSPVILTASVTKSGFQELFEGSFPVNTFNVSSSSGNGTFTADVNGLFSQGTQSGLFLTTSNNDRDTLTMVESVNLTGNAAATLTFSHIAALEGSTTSFDFGIVEYSTNGGQTWSSFTTAEYTGTANNAVFAGATVRFSDRSYTNWSSTIFAGTTPNNSHWQNETFNLPAAALTSTNFKIRFRMTTDISILYYGWLLDNIKINVVPVITGHIWSDGVPANNTFTNPTTRFPVATTNYIDSITDFAGCVYAVPDITVATNPLPAAPVDSTIITTPCGTPTYIVKKVAGSTYQWYNAPTGGTLLFSSAVSSSFTYTAYPGSGVITVYASLTNANGCESIRTPISVTITPPPALAISPTGTFKTCVGSIIPITVTTPTAPYTTWSWTPTSTNLYTCAAANAGCLYTGAGAPTSVWYKSNVAGTETVTVVATNAGGCTGSATIVFTTAEAPVFNGGTATPSTICSGSLVVLKADSSVAGCNTLGNCAKTIGVAQTTAGSGITPFNQFWETSHTQYLILASDLAAKGFLAGNFNSLAFKVTAKNSTLPYTNYTLKMAQTALTNLGAGLTNAPVFTTVFGPTSYTSVSGVNTFALAPTFYWDGISNVIVDVCYANDAAGSGGQLFTQNDVVCGTAMSYQASACIFTDNTDYCGLVSGSNGKTSSDLPDITFCGQVKSTSSSLTYTWNPGALNGTTINVFPTTTPTSTYTVTASVPLATGTTCSSTSANINIAVSANSAIKPTDNGTTPTQCGLPTYKATSAGVSSPEYAWYTDSIGGIALASGPTYTTFLYAGYHVGQDTLWVSVRSGATGCESLRTRIIVTVTAPPALALNLTGTINTCIGTITQVNITPATVGNYTVYTWSPLGIPIYEDAGATTVYDNNPLSPTTVWFKRLIATNDSIAVIARQLGGLFCQTATYVKFSTSSVPTVSSPVIATPDPVCAGGTVTLTAKSSTAVPSCANIGTSSGNTFGASVYRFGNNLGSFKHQLLITAAEMTAAGFTSGNITEIDFNVSSGSGGNADNFTIGMAHTLATNLTTSFLTPIFTTVYSTPNYTTVSGLNAHVFNVVPFNWDGTSNIVVNVCYTSNTVNTSATCVTSTPSFTGNSAILGASGGDCNSTTADFTQSDRAFMRICGQIGTNNTNLYNWTWSTSTTGSASVTAPAAGSTSTSTAITGGGTVTYTATASLNGCTGSLAAAPITINAPSGSGPTNGSTSPQCATSNTPVGLIYVANAPATFTVFRWYKTATSSTVLRTSPGILTTDTFRYSAYTPNGCDTLWVSVSPIGGCETPRTQIIICDFTPALTLSPTAGVTVPTCLNVFQQLKVTSTITDFATYSWAPYTDLYLDNSGSPTPYNGENVSTVYYRGSTLTSDPQCYQVTATTSGGCVNTKSLCFTVNSAPTNVTAVVSTTGPVCPNVGTITLTGNADTTYTTTILSEDFNSNAPNWTIFGNSTAGYGTSNFTLQTSNVFTGAFGGSYLIYAKNSSNVTVPIRTRNGGKFILANHPSVPGLHTTNTIITSPVFSTSGFNVASLALNFEHFYKFGSSDDTVAVEISTNGGTSWSTLINYKALGVNQGYVIGGQPRDTATIPATVSLAAVPGISTAVNVKIRFKYKSADGGSIAGYCWLIDNIKITGQKTIPNAYSWTATPAICASITNSNLKVATAVINCSASFTVTATNGSGCSTTSPPTSTVSVSTLDATATFTDALCFGASSGTITGQGTGGTGLYQYALVDLPGNYVPAVPTSGSQLFTGLAAGFYKVYVKDGACKDSITVIVGQPTLLTLNATSINPPSCHNGCNGSIIVRGLGGIKPYRFSVNGGPLSGPLGNPANALGVNYNILSLCTGTNQDSTYSINILDNKGCNVTINVVLPNPALPTLNATNSGPVCANGSVTLNASPAGYTTYSWTGPNGYTASGTSPVINPMLIADSGDYIVSIITAAGCTNKDTTKVVVHPTVPSSVTISTPDTTVCSSDLVTFTATPTNGGTGATYKFYLNTVLVQNSASNTYGPLTVNNGDIVSVTMTPSINDTSNCSNGNDVNSGTITMIVAANVPASVTLAVDKNPVCAGDSAKFTATPTGGGATPNYQFWVNGIMKQNGLSNTYTTNTLVNGDPVYVIMTSSLSCATGSPATSSTINMTVLALPASPTNTSVATQCGTALVFSATAGAGTIKWYASNVSTTVLGTGSPFNYTGTLGATTTLYVSLTNAAGCESPRVAAAVFASNYPTVSINGLSTQTFCANASIVLSTTSTPGNGSIPAGNYQWYRNLGLIPGAVNSTYTATLPGSYTVTATNSNNCTTTSAAITLNTLAAPVDTLTVNCNPIISGNSATFTIDTTGTGAGGTIQWKLNGSTNVGAGLTTYTTSVAGNYTVIVTNSIGCFDTSNVITLSISTAPLCGVYTIPGTGCTSFPTINAATTYLNNYGVSCAVTFNVATGYTETAPVGGIVLGSATLNSGPNATSAVKTITFQKNGAGAKPKVLAWVGTQTPSSISPDGIWSLRGADFITIDGIDLTDNNAANPATMEYGFGLFKLNAGDGAQNNTIKNSTVTLNRLNNVSSGGTLMGLGSVGIQVVNVTATAATTAITPSSQAGANSNNKFHIDTIQNASGGIFIAGYAHILSPFALADSSNIIGGSPTNACLIRNFGGIAGNPAAGIVTSAQNGIDISYNTVNSNDGGGINHPNVLWGIYNINPVGDAIRPTNINYNTVTLKAGGTTQLVEAIDNISVASTAAANIVNINNNTITGCTYSTATSGRFNGIVNSTPAANLSINNNVFSSNSTNATTDTTSLIYNTGLVTNALNINNNNINGFTFNAATTAGSFVGIRTLGSALGSGVATCDASISNNTFQAIAHNIAGASFHQYIVDIQKTRSHNISSNNFNNLSVSTSASVTFINNDIGLPAGGSSIINNNIITTAFNKTSAGGTVTLYLSNSDSSLAGTTKTERFNNFSNITLTGATAMNGWSDLEGKAVSTGAGATKNISNNTFTNWSCGSGNVVGININKAGTGSRIGSNIIKNITTTSQITGLQTGNGNLGAHTIDSNYVSKYTNSSNITGIQVANSVYTSLNVNNNIVDSLTSTPAAALAVTGINFASNTTAASNVNVFKNKVYNLTSNFAGTQIVTGISMASLFVATNLNVNLSNNIVGNLYSPLGTAPDAIRGIAVNPSGGTNGLYKIYYNTIYLDAVSSAVTFGSTGMYILSSTTATNYATDMRNNIIVNISTPGSTSGNTVAYRRNVGGAGALANYQATSNNNLFFAGTPAANRLIYFDGTSSAQTLAAYQAGVFTAGTIAPRDSASVTELPPFISTVGSNANFLHITAGANSFAESGAQSIAGFTDDYDNQARAATAAGCTSGPDIGADEFVGVPVNATWTGSISTDWNTAGNWCTGVVPTIVTNVKIPSPVTNYPVVPQAGGPFSVKNLTLQSGSSLTTALNAQLSIYGNYSATSTTLVNNGKITIAGTAAQSFPGATTTVTAMQDLEVNNTGGVTIDKSLTITGALTPKAGVIALGSNFITLKSLPGSTARVDTIGATASFTYGTGRFVIERYYPAKRRWHLRTSPVTVDAAKTVYNSWQVGGTAPAGSGTFVSGPGANPATNGLDVSPQNNNSLKSFVGQSFINIGNTKTTLISGTAAVPTVPDNIGYFLFVRGDRTTLANFNVGTANTTTLRDTGKIQINTQIFACKDSIGGFTLMGNPYASPVDFSTLALNKVANKFWAWDPNLNIVGGYALVDIAGGTITIVPSGSGVIQQTKHIQSTQAVFVQTTATGSPTVTFTEPNKSSSDNPGVFRPTGTSGATESLIANLFLRDNDGTLTLADGNLSQFDNTYSAAVDFDDAVKFGNINEQFSITKGTSSMCLERRPPATSGDTIFYKLTKTTIRGYSFNFVAENMDHPGLQGFLMDSYTQSSTPVNLNGPTTYDFNITADAASAASNRFMIVFKQNAVLPVTIKTIKAWKQNADIMVEWKVENQISMKEYEVEKSTDGIHFTKMITTPVSGNNNGGSSTYNWLDVHPVTGVNYYRVRSISLSGNKGYSNIVKVVIGKETPSMVVSPNPVKNGIIALQMNNIPEGMYTARLFNNLGQLLHSASISHSAGSAVESIRPDHALVQGVYQLEIVGEDKTKTLIKVVVE